MNEEHILYKSDEAAKFVTGIEGWVNRHGQFYGKDEHLARWSGCTHSECSVCGKETPVRGYTACDECREKGRVEKYHTMQRQKWDGETPLYSDSHDKYFFDEESLTDYRIDHDCTTESLCLIICEPNEFSIIDCDHFLDDLPEDGEVPSEIEEAVEALNKVIRAQSPASWSPGKFAADLMINPV